MICRLLRLHFVAGVLVLTYDYSNQFVNMHNLPAGYVQQIFWFVHRTKMVTYLVRHCSFSKENLFAGRPRFNIDILNWSSIERSSMRDTSLL